MPLLPEDTAPTASPPAAGPGIMLLLTTSPLTRRRPRRALLRGDPTRSSPGKGGWRAGCWRGAAGSEQRGAGSDGGPSAASGRRMPQVSVMSGLGWLPATWHPVQAQPPAPRHPARARAFPLERGSPTPAIASEVSASSSAPQPHTRPSHSAGWHFCPVFRRWI